VSAAVAPAYEPPTLSELFRGLSQADTDDPEVSGVAR
jgi:hypothetical protein